MCCRNDGEYRQAKVLVPAATGYDRHRTTSAPHDQRGSRIATPAKPSNPRTAAVHAGRDPRAQFGMINPPVWHASTVLFPTLDALDRAIRQPFEGLVYSLLGTPTSSALEQAVAAMEHADRAVAVGSGLAAIAVAIMPFGEAGDHLLVSDGAYGPTRHLCQNWFTLRGMRTAAVRLKQHEASALAVARWLQTPGRKSGASCIRPCPSTRAMPIGNGISPAPPGCSPSSCFPALARPLRPWSRACRCSASASAGAASRA